MNVLVDTPVWSLALRRKPRDLHPREQALTRALAELIREGRAQMMGAIRQELLSGIREEDRFRRLRESLRAFEDPALHTEDYEMAAQMNNACRRRGVACSPIDLLICAVASRRNWLILTADRDFDHYQRVLGITLFEAGTGS